MQIVFAASECVPFAKTGGLADVVGALAPEMVSWGMKSRLLPFYARVRRHIEGERSLRRAPSPFHSSLQSLRRIVDGASADGVRYYFVDCPSSLIARSSTAPGRRLS